MRVEDEVVEGDENLWKITSRPTQIAERWSISIDMPDSLQIHDAKLGDGVGIVGGRGWKAEKREREREKLVL